MKKVRHPTPIWGRFLLTREKLLVLGEGALKRNRSGFVLCVGSTFLGNANCDVDYILVIETLSKNVLRSPFLNYQPDLILVI